MSVAGLRERLAAASLLLSDPAMHAEAETELFQYMARIVRARRNATEIQSENPNAIRASALDSRAVAVMREWERSPIVSYADLRERFQLSSGTASRTVTKLSESGVLVKDGRWWKLANQVHGEAKCGRSQRPPSEGVPSDRA